MVADVARAPITQLEHCRSNPVKPQNIPELLKGLPNWVIWKAFAEKNDGRFDKVPISKQTGHKVSHIEARVNARNGGAYNDTRNR